MRKLILIPLLLLATSCELDDTEQQFDAVVNEPTYFGSWTLHKIYDEYGEEYIISESFSKKELKISEEEFGIGPSAYDFTYNFTFETCKDCRFFPLPIDNYLGGLYPTAGDILSFVQLWEMPNKLANNANFYLPDYNSLILEFENGNTDPDDPKGYTMFFFRNGRPKSQELDSAINTFLSNNEANQVSSNNNSINEVENSSLSILNDVGDVKPGPDGVPGTIQIDNCDWKPVFSDNRGNIAAAYNEDNNTLLITHADYFFSPGYNSGADNRTFFENILGTNKKGLFSIGINFETELIDPFLDHMISLGNSGRNFISDSSIEQTIADLEVGFNQLSDYDYLIYNPEDNRLSTSEISLLRDYIDDPNKTTILVGLGWVWASYHRENQAELMPLNILLEPYGVQFVTDGNTPDHYTYDIHNETIYYPDTYITKTDYFDCSLGD